MRTLTIQLEGPLHLIDLESFLGAFTDQWGVPRSAAIEIRTVAKGIRITATWDGTEDV